MGRGKGRSTPSERRGRDDSANQLVAVGSQLALETRFPPAVACFTSKGSITQTAERRPVVEETRAKQGAMSF